ncbi:MAG UNVERIFIED_CONTAM: hypothetical protein LVQ98_01815 [Rickettsiaceae bacterium]|jgi:inactivated superfamily I helicase
MNENNIPSQVMLDPWMSTKMRDNLGLSNRFEKIGIEWSHFKNLLYRENILLTRSRKKYGLEVPPSRFIQELISSGELNVTI